MAMACDYHNPMKQYDNNCNLLIDNNFEFGLCY